MPQMERIDFPSRKDTTYFQTCWLQRSGARDIYLSVCHTMVVEVGACCEPLTAHATHVRLLARVDAAMCIEGAGSTKGLAAYITAVRFLA